MKIFLKRGLIAITLVLFILPVQARAALGDGVFIYDQTTPTTNVQERSWTESTATVGSASSPFAGSGTSKHIFAKGSPKRKEILVGIQDSAGTLTIYKSTDDGVTWASQWTATVGDGNLRRFDIAYEQNSGDALVVYSANVATTNEIKYQTWNGTSWSGALSLDPVRTSGTVYGVKTAERPNSDEIGVMWADTNFDLSANLWTGSAWYGEPGAALSTSISVLGSASAPTERAYDLSFESLSGDLMVIWGDNAGVVPKYVIKAAGGAWGSVVTPGSGFGEEGEMLDIASSPISDKIAYIACSADSGSDCNFVMWSGSAWGTAASDTTAGTPVAGDGGNNVEWLVDGVNEVAIYTYNDASAGGLDWYTSVNGATPTAQTDNSASPAIAGAERAGFSKVNPSDPREGVFIFEDANADIFVKRAYLTTTTVAWSNPTGLAAAIEANASVTGFNPIGFAFVKAIIPVVTTQAESAVTKTTATFNGTITATTPSSTVRGFAWGTNSALSGGDTATTTDNGTWTPGAFTYYATGLTCNTTYYYRPYATNTAGTGLGSIEPFVSTACNPTVTTQSASSVGQTSATLNGNITATGGGNAMVRGFAWGTLSNLSGGDTATTTENGSFGTGAFTDSAQTFTCNTTYYSRAYATNAGGTSYGAISSSFTTSACASPPTVTTQEESAVTQTTVTLNGTITATGGTNATVRGFAYGTSATLATVIATTTENGSFGTGAFTYNASTLTCNTTYYSRPYATSPGGTSLGTIDSFVTSPCNPTVTTSSASSVGATSATLNGNITATGGANATTRGFAWGTLSNLSGGDTATTTDPGSWGTGAFTNSSLTLVCNTTYYSRAYATNPSGTSFGAISSSFTTTACKPTVTTSAASSVAQTTAVLNGNITATGGANATTRGFAYGTDPTLASVIATTTENGTFGVAAFNTSPSPLTGLSCNTTYYARAYATNPAGTSFGAISASFTTTACNPTLTTYTNSTESALNYAGACTTCGARIGGGAGFRQTVVITGTGFGADPGAGNRSSASNNIKIGTHQIASANVTAWSSSSITFLTDSAVTGDTDADWGTNFGGASALTVTAGSLLSTTGLNFNLFPQVTSVTQPAGFPADSAREYDAGDSDGLITLNGTRFGTSLGTGYVRVLGCDSTTCSSPSGSVTTNSWTNTAIVAQIPPVIADNSYTGSLVMQQGTGSNAKTFTYTASGFRILPRITSFSPTSGTSGDAVTVNGNHLCENGGTCPGSFSSANKVTFTSAVDATAFGSWSSTAIGTQVPAGAVTGNVVVTSNTVYTSNGMSFAVTSAPTVTTQAESAVTQTTVTLNGTITATGGANSTVRGFAYGTSATLATTIATTTENGSFSTGAFTGAVSSLTCNTTYYARPYATNPSGTGYGSIDSFVTSPCSPTVTTQAESAVTQTTVTLNGTITVTGGANATVRGFAYGTSATLSTTIATTTENGSFGTGAFTYNASSLTCNTTYYARPYATNSSGTGFGTVDSFVTSPCIPTVTTQNESAVTQTTVTLNGTITATGGGNATVRGFAYGTSATLATVIATTTENGSFGTGAFTGAISSLTCNTTYYSRPYATNPGGTGYGTIDSFITSACTPTLTVGTTAGSEVTNLNSGDQYQYMHTTACSSPATCAAFTLSIGIGSETVTSIKLTETGTVNATNNLSNVALLYDTDGNFSNGVAGTFGTTTAFTADAATVSGSLAISAGTTYYFYVRAFMKNGTNYPAGGDTVDFQIAANSDVGTSGAPTKTGAPVSLAGSTTIRPVITGYTNSTESALDYTAACTDCGARIGGGAGFRQSVTISGFGFGADPGLGNRDTASNKVEVVGAATTKLIDDGSASTNVSAWSNTSITIRTDSTVTGNTDADWGTNFGGTDALKVTAGSEAVPTNLNFYLFPQVTSITQPAGFPADSAREYNSGDSDGVITLNGTRFGSAIGSAGYVRIFGCHSVGCSAPPQIGALSALGTPTIGAGGSPFGVTISPDGTSVYVTDFSDSTISQYSRSATTGNLSPLGTPTVSTDTHPYGIIISPNGASVYTYTGNNTISQYSRNTGTGALTALGTPSIATGAAPNGIAISSDGTSVYVTNFSDDTVSQYSRNTGTGALTALGTPTVATGSGPSGVTVSPDGTSVYVANSGGSGTVSQYSRNTGTGALTPLGTPTVASGSFPTGIAISPDGASVYVANNSDSTVSQYSRNTGTGALTALGTPTIGTGASPNGIVTSSDGMSVYVANFSGGTVSQYSRNTGTGALTALGTPTISAGAGPQALAISEDGASVYTGNNGDNTVSQYRRVNDAGSVATASWSDTAITAQVPEAIANNAYTGSIVLRQGTGGTAKTHTYTSTGFRILPRITGFTPASGVNGDAITVDGDHLCENGGSCPGSFSSANKATFTSAVDATVFTSWSNSAIATEIPSAAVTGDVVVTSDTAYTSNGQSLTIATPVPSDPTNLGQYRDSGLTRSIATGGISSSTPLYITMTMTAPVSGGTLYPQVEYKPVGTGFSCSGTGACGSATEGSGVAGPGPIDCSTVGNSCAVSISPVDGVYHWQARVRHNKAGTDYYSAWVSYPTPSANLESAIDIQVDTTGATITGISSGTPGSNSATITWDTSGEQSTSQVQFNKTGAFTTNCATDNDCTTIDLTPVYSHSVSLINIDSGTTYYYRVRSVDFAGVETISTTHTFATASVTQPAKTTYTAIFSEPTVLSAATTTYFTINAPETGISVKSAYVELTGLVSGGSNPISIQANANTSSNFAMSATNPTLVHLLYKIADQSTTITENVLNFNDDAPCTNGATAALCNEVTIIPGSGMSIYITSARFVMTYGYTP